MLITENVLRKIIAEEYEKLHQEVSPIYYRGRNLRNDPSLYSQTGGGASPTEAALQTLYSIFSRKTESDMTPDLEKIAKELYDKYVGQYGKEAVDGYIKKNKLVVLSKYSGIGEGRMKPRRDPINVMSKEEEREYKKKYGNKEDAKVPRQPKGGDDYRKGDD